MAAFDLTPCEQKSRALPREQRKIREAKCPATVLFVAALATVAVLAAAVVSVKEY